MQMEQPLPVNVLYIVKNHQRKKYKYKVKGVSFQTGHTNYNK